MVLRETIQKAKVFFHETLQNLKSFLFGGYQKLPKIRPLNPLSHCEGHPNMQHMDQFYSDLSEQWESGNGKVMKSEKTVMSAKEPVNEEDACLGSSMKFQEKSALKNKHEERDEEENKIGSSCEGRREPCSDIANGGGYALAQKMKELEMMDMNDLEHVLDIEEVLHYYSHLTCPAYLDLVDKFFMDMYSDFFLPQPSSVNISNSSRRLGPLKF